jgi:hypothetical protein
MLVHRPYKLCNGFNLTRSLRAIFWSPRTTYDQGSGRGDNPLRPAPMSVAGSGREGLQVVQWIKMHRDRTLGAAAVRDRGHRPAAQGELF